MESNGNRPSITARTLLLLLRVYQTYLSPLNFSSCRFYPSCSHYAGEAVERFGARRGVWLTLKRLVRCQPFSRGGFDPVPDLAPYTRVSSQSEDHFGDGLYQGTPSAVPNSASNSGALAPANRPTRGQEFAR